MTNLVKNNMTVSYKRGLCVDQRFVNSGCTDQFSSSSHRCVLSHLLFIIIVIYTIWCSVFVSLFVIWVLFGELNLQGTSSWFWYNMCLNSSPAY